MVSSRTEKAFELSFFLEFLSAKEPNRPQKVVTSGYEVITSDPDKYTTKRIPTFGTKVKLENIHKIFQTFDLQHLTVRCTTYGLGADGRTNRRTSVIVLGVFEAVCTVRIQRQGPASVTDHRYQVDKMTFHGLHDTIL